MKLSIRQPFIKNLFLFQIFTFIGAAPALAQATADSLQSSEDYIINTHDLRRGIYKSFEEFKYNSPSYDGEFTFTNKSVWVTDDKGKPRKLNRKELWGFCDGKRIFVSWRKYDEILAKGRYCYFQEKGTRIIFGVTSYPPMILPIPVPYKDELIINYNTGKIFLLTKRLVKQIFTTDDPELLKEFQHQTRKGKKLLEYIVRYNERNISKIK